MAIFAKIKFLFKSTIRIIQEIEKIQQYLEGFDVDRGESLVAQDKISNLEIENKALREKLGPRNMSDEEKFKFLLHTETTFNSRINYFILAQSMLLMSFFAALATFNENDTPSFLNLLLGLSIFITLTWLMIDIKSFDKFKIIQDDIKYENYKKMIGNSIIKSNNL